MNNPVGIDRLPDVIRESPDVMPHDHVLHVVQELICCTKAQAIEITIFALVADCTVMEALHRLYGNKAAKLVQAAVGI